MFGQDSWKRPEPSAARSGPRPEYSGQVTGKSLRGFLGEKRLKEWSDAAASADISLENLMATAGQLANSAACLSPQGEGRHYDAKGHLRVLLSDAIRAHRQRAENAHLPLPLLY